MSPPIASKTFIRPFLKWAGGKYRLLPRIINGLPPGKRLIEPFAGSGVVFLNAGFKDNLIADANPDLIALYQVLQQQGERFIEHVKTLFTPENNEREAYYRLREAFNAEQDPFQRSALFVYLNRHGYNGLMRYSAKGGFNVPFGRYKRPLCPADGMHAFHHHARQTKFICEDFRKTLSRARRGVVVYADPPYVPLSETAYFTGYNGKNFSNEDQADLACCAERMAKRGITTLISNHDTPFTRKIYREAELTYFSVRRQISCDGRNRKEVGELLACFAADY